MAIQKNLGTYAQNTWCPGCGNFAILNAMKTVLLELEAQGVPLERFVLASGIGCHGKIVDYINVNSFYSIHGRATPVAEGIKLANHGLTVIVIGGDGDQYGEGGNHLIHAARRNVDLTVIIHNNQIYGLTTGQASPTSDLGMKNKVELGGVVEAPLNPLSLAISSGATFVARGFAGDTRQQTELLVSGIKHKGFALIDTLQPCVTFNHKNTFPWFYERIYKLEKDYDSGNKINAFAKAEEWPLRVPLKASEKEKIPTGVFFQEERPTWHEQIPQIKETPLVKQTIEDIDITPLFEEFI